MSSINKFIKIQKTRLKAVQKLKSLCEKRNEKDNEIDLIEYEARIQEIQTSIFFARKFKSFI